MSGSATSGRMRLAMGLTIVGAALLITGLLMVFVGEAQRLKATHSHPGIVRTGEFVAVCGLGIGVALLIAMTLSRADRGRAVRGRANRGKRRRAGAPRTGPRRDPAGQWLSPRPDPAGQWLSPRPDPAGQWLSPRPDPAEEWLRPPHESAEEWLSPLRTAGAGLVAQRALLSGPEPVEESGPGSGDYADDGWRPEMDVWDPGPAYVWNPYGEDDWGGGDRDRRPGGHEDWNPTPDVTTWPSDDLRMPGRNDQEPSPPAEYPASPRRGYQIASQSGYLSGPPPGYLAGPEPEQASSPEGRRPSGPEPPYLTDAWPASAGGRDGGPASGDPSRVPVIRDSGEPASHAGRSEPALTAPPASVWEPVSASAAEKPGSVWEPVSASAAEKPGSVWEPVSASAQEKLDQIKDLYLTAEAIGEDALVKHFDALSQRQRALIQEYFERAGLRADGARADGARAPTGGDAAENGASLPG